MDSGFILSIVVTIIIGSLTIIVALYPAKFREAIQKLGDSFKSPPSSFAKIKYTIIISVVGAFLSIAIILAWRGDFDLRIFHIIGSWSLCFLVLLRIEQIGEKGDKYTQPS